MATWGILFVAVKIDSEISGIFHVKENCILMRSDRRWIRFILLIVVYLPVCVAATNACAGFDHLYLVVGQPKITDSEDFKDRDLASRGAIGFGSRQYTNETFGVGIGAWHIVAELVSTSN